MNVIKEIAGQTNLLALNAAVDGTQVRRAGARVKVVVEPEVRKPAEHDQQSLQPRRSINWAQALRVVACSRQRTTMNVVVGEVNISVICSGKRLPVMEKIVVRRENGKSNQRIERLAGGPLT